VPLHRPATVRGAIVAGGKPVAGASAFLIGTGPLADAQLAAWQQWRPTPDRRHAGSPSWTPLAARSDELGAFAIDRVPPGVPLRLAVWHREFGMAIAPLPLLRTGDTHDLGRLHLSGR
jgi:hypothetical protein